MDANQKVTLTKFINASQLDRPVEWLPGLTIITSKCGDQVREQLIAEGPIAEAMQQVVRGRLAASGSG